MSYAAQIVRRYASWLDGADQPPADRALANPTSVGSGSEMIGFGGGQPATEMYPLEALARAYRRAILDEGPDVLPYGATEGLPALRALVAERLGRRGMQVDPANVMILSGSLQGLHLLGRITLDTGDTIVTEAPTFMGALACWEDREPRYLTVRVDAHGMLVDSLRQALRHAERSPKFVYLLPTFQNPSGVSLTTHRRQELLELAIEHDLLIVEDDPYGELWFDEGAEPIAPVRSLPGAAERVIYLGTFSKILAPGIRLGYAVVPPDMVRLLTQAKRGVDYHTDTLLQQAIVHLIRDAEFDLEAHVAAGRRMYKQRRDAMLDALEDTLTAGSKWTRPSGGFFLWVDLPHGLSGDAVAEAGLAQGVSVFPGSLFYPNGDGGLNGLRLSFADASPERIREGILRLQRAIVAVDAAR